MNGNQKWIICLLIFVGLIFPLIPFAVYAEEIDGPNDSTRVYVYNNKTTYIKANLPAVYVITDGTDAEATGFRVYSNKNCRPLYRLGEGKVNAAGNCAITLSSGLNQTKTPTLYVTRMVGDEESTSYITASVGAQVSPQVTLNVHQVDQTQAIPTTSAEYETSYFQTSLLSANASIIEGNYYEAEVLLRDFTYLDFVTIPLHFDPMFFEPAAISTLSSGNKLSGMTSSSRTAGAAGLNIGISAPFTDAKKYGILPGVEFSSWTATGTNGQSYYGQFSPATVGGLYQYVNTSTGTYRIETSLQYPAGFGTSKNSQFIRFFFKAIRSTTVESISELIHFATENDVPEEFVGSASKSHLYYDPSCPDGIFPSLSGLGIIYTAPLALTESTVFKTSSPLNLSAIKLASIPSDYTDAVGAALLNPDEVKIYNYTNYQDSVGTFSLDSIDDRIIISSSSAIHGNRDSLRVYTKSGNTYTQIAEQQASGDGSVDIGLGTQMLSPDGGSLWMSVVHYGLESQKVEVTYPAEVRRTVTFQIMRSGWTKESAYNDYGENSDVLADLKKGEHIQIRLRFNHFRDLLSYGFVLRYNPLAVQAADQNYQIIDTGNAANVYAGTIFESDYRRGQTPFSVGEDAMDVTLTEELIYQASLQMEDMDDDERAEYLDELLYELGIEEDEFYDTAKRVAVSHAANSMGTGGLLFTVSEEDEKEEASEVFPYVDNETGYLQFMSTSLVALPDLEDTNGDGYHLLSINFVVTGSGQAPRFELYRDKNPVMLQGKQIVLVGGEHGVGINDQWLVYPMEAEPTPPTFDLFVELYPAGKDPTKDADAEPVDPTSLIAGERYEAFLKYEALTGAGAGLDQMEVAFSYDPDYVEITDLAGISNEITAMASENGNGRQTVKFRFATTAAAQRLNGGSGYLGHGTVTPLLAFAEDDQVQLVWEDYAVRAYTGEDTSVAYTYSRDKLRMNTEFTEPDDVLLVADDEARTYSITLRQGNATAQDVQRFGENGAELGVSETTVFLYDGTKLKDPGFTVYDQDGHALDDATQWVSRYYKNTAGGKVSLAAWSGEEQIGGITVRTDDAGRLKYSDHYTVYYSYRGQLLGQREVFVLFRRGDVDRNGEIDLFDEQMLANHLNGFQAIAAEAADIYWSKTVDVDEDGTPGLGDRYAIRDYDLGVRSIQQEYVVYE